MAAAALASAARAPRAAREEVENRTIILNIYDVTQHPFSYAWAKALTLGIHHTGIQVGMREFAFTLEGACIVITEPHKVPRCTLTHRTVLTRSANERMLHVALKKLSMEFTPRSYDPLTKNCNHFSFKFCEYLGAKMPPAWVNRAPELASSLGTRFRLRPPKITAPPVSWSVLIAHGESRLTHGDKSPATPAWARPFSPLPARPPEPIKERDAPRIRLRPPEASRQLEGAAVPTRATPDDDAPDLWAEMLAQLENNEPLVLLTPTPQPPDRSVEGSVVSPLEFLMNGAERAALVDASTIVALDCTLDEREDGEDWTVVVERTSLDSEPRR
ncbi:hypothetical protein M885DRAFT_488966 [Pelagophyceae sp. CCMP2097]|nr:hypothetical protein M885DRAFT_488966 [Pelagophyceae sp. CCMP2097]